MEKKTMLETGLKYLGVGTLLWGLITPWAVAGPEQDTELAEKEFARGDLVAALPASGPTRFRPSCSPLRPM